MYRSIRDTGEFEVEDGKTIFVGPNEAGKTVILQALQQLKAAKGIEGFEPLRDYPRAEYNKDIGRGAVDPSTVTVTEGHFKLEPDDLEGLPQGFESCTFVCGRKLDNSSWHRIDGGPSVPTYSDLTKDLARLCAYVDGRKGAEGPAPSAALTDLTKGWNDTTRIEGKLIDVPPFEYLKDVLRRLATHPHRLIDQLTPRGWAKTFRPTA